MKYQNQDHTMEQQFDWDKFIAIICGITGGIYRFLQVHLIEVEPAFWTSLLKAALTAFVCGFMGLVGKALFVWIKDYFKKGKHKKKKT